MEILEYSRMAYRSARKYLEYLRSHKKGREVINVYSIDILNDFKAKLIISKKTNHLDYLKIKVVVDGLDVELSDEDARIVLYNDFEPYIIISLNERAFDIVSNASPKDITIESDLTFLVENVMEWYYRYHDCISLSLEDKKYYYDNKS